MVDTPRSDLSTHLSRLSRLCVCDATERGVEDSRHHVPSRQTRGDGDEVGKGRNMYMNTHPVGRFETRRLVPRIERRRDAVDADDVDVTLSIERIRSRQRRISSRVLATWIESGLCSIVVVVVMATSVIVHP